VIAEIGAALGAIKTSGDLIRGVLAADKALETADLKLRLADAASTLLDARMAVMDAQTAVDAKDAEIARLNDALSNKAKVARHGSAYYELNEAGRPSGHAYCMRCFEVEHRLYHLAYTGYMGNIPCPVCKTEYAHDAVYEIR
jgi:hypothetical protein